MVCVCSLFEVKITSPWPNFYGWNGWNGLFVCVVYCVVHSQALLSLLCSLTTTHHLNKMVVCSIRNCKSVSVKGSAIRFFRFPLKESVANEWLRYCGPKTTTKNGM